MSSGVVWMLLQFADTSEAAGSSLSRRLKPVSLCGSHQNPPLRLPCGCILIPQVRSLEAVCALAEQVRVDAEHASRSNSESSEDSMAYQNWHSSFGHAIEPSPLQTMCKESAKLAEMIPTAHSE